jgi:hypothetical protein
MDVEHHRLFCKKPSFVQQKFAASFVCGLLFCLGTVENKSGHDSVQILFVKAENTKV